MPGSTPRRPPLPTHAPHPVSNAGKRLTAVSNARTRLAAHRARALSGEARHRTHQDTPSPGRCCHASFLCKSLVSYLLLEQSAPRAGCPAEGAREGEARR